MVCLAKEDEFIAALPGYRLDNAQAEVEVLKQRTLFDVKFDKGEGVRVQYRVWDLCRAQPEGSDRRGQRRSLSISPLKKDFIEFASQRAAADKRDCKPNPFFFRKRHHFDIE